MLSLIYTLLKLQKTALFEFTLQMGVKYIHLSGH